MSSLRLFAAREDQLGLLDFLFNEMAGRVLETYSEPDCELREFRSASDVARVFRLGEDKHGNSFAHHLWVHLPGVCGRLRIGQFELDPRACNGATFRYQAESNGGINLLFGGVHQHWLTISTISRNSRERAGAWGVADGVDWTGADRAWRRIAYHIGTRAAVARLPGVPILPEAWRLAGEGAVLTCAAASTLRYDIKDAKVLERKRASK